jgi:hypothetical protein
MPKTKNKLSAPIILLRIEGALIFLGSTYVFHTRHGNLLVFILVFLAIDLTMAGYLVNNRIGATIYNLGHTLIVPILIYLIARATDGSGWSLLAAIWFAHIGLDRALGYGLKLPTGFRDTHLGRIGH